MFLKPHHSFQNENNTKVTDGFDPGPLIFKLQQEVLKFNDIRVSWGSSKTDLVRNFLKSENQNFESVSFFQ